MFITNDSHQLLVVDNQREHSNQNHNATIEM